MIQYQLFCFDYVPLQAKEGHYDTFKGQFIKWTISGEVPIGLESHHAEILEQQANILRQELKKTLQLIKFYFEDDIDSDGDGLTDIEDDDDDNDGIEDSGDFQIAFMT